MEILLIVFGAALGAVFSYYFHILVENYKNKRKSEIFGKWYASYQSLREGIWKDEIVKIGYKNGKIFMKNISNPTECYYEAHGELVEKTYIIGTWKSVMDGANAIGTMMLTISANGRHIYGYWVGSADTGERRFRSWVLAKEENRIGKAKEMLMDASIAESPINPKI